MIEINTEYEYIVIHALSDYNIKCFKKIGEYERYPNHCEFWCKEKAKAQAALDHLTKQMAAQGK
jgi:hypothetical protein